jgi:hypothetical protein
VLILPMLLPAFHPGTTWEGFTAAYGCKRLLYFEACKDIRTAIAREIQVKGWRREKKLDLIGTINPEFKDLASPGDGRRLQCMKRCTRDHPVLPQQILFSGFGGRKGPEPHG